MCETEKNAIENDKTPTNLRLHTFNGKTVE